MSKNASSLIVQSSRTLPLASCLLPLASCLSLIGVGFRKLHPTYLLLPLAFASCLLPLALLNQPMDFFSNPYLFLGCASFQAVMCLTQSPSLTLLA